MKIIPSFPCVDLDGTPFPRCDHHTFPDRDQAAVIRGLGEGIIHAGIPDWEFHAGEIVTTTWGCEQNTRMKTRQVCISRVNVSLARHPQSMFYLPIIRYIAWPIQRDGTPAYFPCGAMVLEDATLGDRHWHISPECNEMAMSTFWMEQISPVTHEMQCVPGCGVHLIQPRGGVQCR
jgi:hypothetical protein